MIGYVSGPLTTREATGSFARELNGPLAFVERGPVKELSSEVEIEAPAERVWQILTDFARFPEWNPFIHELTGEAKEGGRLKVRIGASGTRPMSFNPKVLKVEQNRELRWLGRLWIPGLFNGEHSFTIEPLDEKRVRFVQREKFTGVLVPFMAKSLDRDASRGFEEMNRALKDRAEQFR